ncbi:MAG TPA: DUF3142 domain-containing protein [Thermoanaerobaculia bacterium]|nr:DUF3142 domain-containing protein [Thermoanaerobaculia bacterium]
MRKLPVLILAALLAACSRGRASGPLAQEAYVWQHAWTPAVREAVGKARDFRSLVVLGAEVDLSSRPPRISRPAIAWDVLKGRPVGLALRIGRFHGWSGNAGDTGWFAGDPETVRLLARLAADLAREAKSHGLDLWEIQLDYDCPESKLADYPVLVRAVKKAVNPVPVTLTALPSWLRNERAFRDLARSADGFVLQVHFLRTPTRPDQTVELVDPQEAIRAVDQAAKAGQPFRVALPTYAYGAVFDERGALLGLAAEGSRRTARAEVSADPQEIASLVRTWTRSRPEEMQGLIWYRLPTVDDARNWPWETLRAVMAGRVPRAGVRAEIREPKPLLHEIDVINTGESEIPIPSPLYIRWDSDTLMAADAIAGTRLFRSSPREARLEAPATVRLLRPGERRTVAWLRFTRPAEVHVEIPSLPPGQADSPR